MSLEQNAQELLAVIERIAQEHARLRQNLANVGESMNDAEALLVLGKTYSGWMMASNDEMSRRMEQIKLALSALESGVDRHFTFRRLRCHHFLAMC
jgi:hypothetical protein